MHSYVIVNDDVLRFIEDDMKETVKLELYKKYEEVRKDSKKIPIERFFDVEWASGYKPFIIECGKCKHKTLYFKNISTNESGDRCIKCQEVDLNRKFEKGLDKIRRLRDLSKSYSESNFYKRDINQQIVILLSTVLETYMRDFYVGISNIKFCKNNQNLTSRFLKECKNDFLNPDKANERLKKDIWPEWNEDKRDNQVGFKDLLGPIYYSRLEVLSAFRNVIVHNSGFVDPPFKNFFDKNAKNEILSDHDYEIGDPIIITDKIITDLEMAVEACVHLSNRLYECELQKEVARLLVDQYVKNDNSLGIDIREGSN